MLWLVTDQVKLFICSPCLFRVDNKVFICLSVPGWSLWSGFNRPTFWMFWSRCDVTHISWRKHQQATSSTIYSTSCWIKEVVMRSPISFDTTRPSVECQMWAVMSKRVNIESLKKLFPAAGHFLVVLRVAQLAQKYDSQTVQHIQMDRRSSWWNRSFQKSWNFLPINLIMFWCSGLRVRPLTHQDFVHQLQTEFHEQCLHTQEAVRGNIWQWS